MDQPTHVDVTDFAELAIALVREQAAETRLLPIAARPAVGHPNTNRSTGSTGRCCALGRMDFPGEHRHPAVLRSVGDPDKLDFEIAMGRAMPAHR